MVDQVDPLEPQAQYVTSAGTPTLKWMILWQTAMQRLVGAINDIVGVQEDVAAAAADVAALKGATYVTLTNSGTLDAERQLTGTTDIGLTDGGANSTVTVGLLPTTVVAGTYGDASHVAQVTVDAKGRVTGATEVAIADTGSWIPLVDGSEPPAFITDGAGTLIVVAYA